MAKTEIWIDKPDIPQVVMDMLVATAQEYSLILWVNGVKIHDPNVTEEEQRKQALLGQ